MDVESPKHRYLWIMHPPISQQSMAVSAAVNNSDPRPRRKSTETETPEASNVSDDNGRVSSSPVDHRHFLTSLKLPIVVEATTYLQCWRLVSLEVDTDTDVDDGDGDEPKKTSISCRHRRRKKKQQLASAAAFRVFLLLLFFLWRTENGNILSLSVSIQFD